MDIDAYKQILLQSNAHRAKYSPRGKNRANRGLKYTQFILGMFRPVTWSLLLLLLPHNSTSFPFDERDWD
jgi:hypothetical protein